MPITHKRYFFIILTVAVVLGCQKHGPLLTLSPEAGIESIHATQENHYEITCPTGICRLNLTINHSIETPVFLHLNYTNRPFEKIEGLECLQSKNPAPVFTYHPPNTLVISPKQTPINCQLQIIDYYRQ